MISKLGSFLGEVLQVVVFAISIFLFVYLLILQPHKIKGESMEPNFFDGEYLLTDKVTYRFGDPSRGDVVVFKAPPVFQDEYIKRIIGLPGDLVKIVENKIYINGNELREAYLPDNFKTRPNLFLSDGKEVKVPADEFFVMGDNRDHSLDSRAFGFVERKYITGRAWLIYWPLDKSGIIEAPTYLF